MFATLVMLISLAAIQAEEAAADAEFAKTVQALPDTPEGEMKADLLWKSFDANQSKRFSRALELAKVAPDSEIALDALQWMLTIPRSYYQTAGIPAMRLAAKHHARNPRIGRTIAMLGRFKPHHEANSREHDAAMDLFRIVANENPDRSTRGQAVAGLARHAFNLFAMAEYRRSPETDKFASEAERQFESLLKEYGIFPDLASRSKRTLGDEAKEELFELRSLRIGKIAPEIEAADLDGKTFKLSESRGKVTVLVFWAGWCGPCMAEVPHEKKLVQRLASQPFALIGVNGDEDPKKGRDVAAKTGINWRSFWNGRDGEIARAWNLKGWPTVYVLDKQGVIRFKHVRDKELDAAVDELLKAK